MNRIKERISFSGCSCGCTPSESAEFEGAEEDVIRAAAIWANEYRTYGSNPYRKVTASEKVIEKAQAFQDQTAIIEKLKDGIKHKEVQIKSWESSAMNLKIPIPEDIQEKIGVLKKECSKLKEETVNLQNNLNKSMEHNADKRHEEEDE